MKKTLILSIFCLNMVFSVFGGEGNTVNLKSTSIEIVVVDATTDEPVPAAKVILNQDSLETYTDFEGFVRIDNISPGSYDIEISFISYKSQYLKAYDINKAYNKLLIKLQP